MIDLVSFIPRAVVQGIPLLYGSTGETLTEKAGNLNLGIPGVMYVGAISGVIGSFFYEQSGEINGFFAIAIPLLCSLLGSLIMGLIYCFLTVTLRANQNVTGLAMIFLLCFSSYSKVFLFRYIYPDISVLCTFEARFHERESGGAVPDGRIIDHFL